MQTRLGERSAAWRRQLPRQHPRKGGRVPLSQHHHVTNASSESSNRNVPRAGGPSAQPRPGGSNLENGMDGGSRPSTSTLKNSISKTSSITVTPAASASSLNRSLLVALAEQFQREALPWIQDLVVPLLEGPPQPLRGPTEPPEKLADRDSRFITVHGVQLHYKMASPGQREGHMTAPAGAAATAPRTQSAENMPAAAAASSPAASGHKRVPVTAPLPPPMTTSHRESPEPSAPFQVSSVMVGRSGSSSTTTTSSLPSLSSLSSSSSTSGSVSTLRSSSPLVGGGSGNSASPPNPHPSPDAAPMLLLMHGLNGSTFSWRLLMDDLSAYVSPSTGGCRVVAYDRPPYGLSQRPLTWRREEDNPYTLAGGARLAAGLLDALLGPTPAQSAASGAAPGAAVLQQRASDVGKQAVLVGHSAGASVAVETALRWVVVWRVYALL
ncbi:hypothetical protein Vretimale_12718 [Volvox reticuliferus]|uniref:AB hydrolase-1 domain-containing protein n=1 Tax=Volvox reticuliferus TaxID=1737510 RepID=A0A8J4D688_9CHLO|nr:hypothetical protein Vretifemale_20850 [Volvox reticuliferus]GIM08725.1 hypothetical protein Vretimale_12718 [Volvox reticuliferus]